MIKVAAILGFLVATPVALGQYAELGVGAVVSAGQACPAMAKAVKVSLDNGKKELTVDLPEIEMSATQSPGFKRTTCQFTVSLNVPKTLKVRVSKARIPISGKRKEKDTVSLKHYLQAKGQDAVAEYNVAQAEEGDKALDLDVKGAWTECGEPTTALIFNLSSRSMPGAVSSSMVIKSPVTITLETKPCS